ncbi:uncharacterized protein Z520_03535 [Fonsecaea multimorphosa CBS 102226]|uniref:Uncharacterized protein n=1 Tax=Fonsecaea multimorphosa CBS 102226 TaxID=1442371 RepID=A0A0D2KVV5_9EURO|nr:uncharacterized protein Z520_03535 [Fonsecaea multimorphosa CBS 102226]KIY00869.1 hypothetical protein Z520_03535 [Fonsecaea multimorphosa CBS 102226]OAL27696.1 hypothetical protein AYO22_03362 [Fonsecaea multimorphosa]
MASQPEGSTSSSPIKGWTSLHSDSESGFSNSNSLEELFEQNRLHLTVNPLDPFLPTIRPTNNLLDNPLLPEAPQFVSSMQLDLDSHDADVETDLSQFEFQFSELNTAVPDVEFRLEDFLEGIEDFAEGDFSADLHSDGYAAPIQEQYSFQEDLANLDNLDFHDLAFVPDEPANEAFALDGNDSFAAQGLANLDTFDADYWFSFPTEVDIQSPLPPDEFVDASLSRYPRTPEEVHLLSRSSSDLADFYGYSELLAQPGPSSASWNPPTDAFLTPQDQGPQYQLTSQPHQVGVSQFPQVMQQLPVEQQLPELNFSHIPVVDDAMELLLVPPTNENTNTAAASDSATESGSSATSSSSSTLSSPARGRSESTRQLYRTQKWYEEGARRQQEAAARSAGTTRQRLARRRENHRQHRERVREGQQREHASRRLHGSSRSPPHLTIPRSVPTQQAPVIPPVVLPTGNSVANTSPRVSWYQKEDARTGEVLGYVRCVEEFYTQLPTPVAPPVFNPLFPVASPVPAAGAALLTALPPPPPPQPQRGQAPVSTSITPAAPAARAVIVIDDSDSGSPDGSPLIVTTRANPVRRSDRLRKS